MIENVSFFALWLVIFVASALNIPKDVLEASTAEFSESPDNLRPIIGILAQEMSKSMMRVDSLKNSNSTSYIAASYVKFIEAAGARVVPIRINQPDSYYEKLANSLNGVLFPGGSASITTKSGYGRAGKKMYSLILQKGLEGNFIPLWGTCLGFEMLIRLIANDSDPLTRCNATNLADSLKLQPDFNQSTLFRNIPLDLLTALQTKNITSNFHKFCVTPETFSELKLEDSLLLLSTTKDSENIDYISTIEHKFLPMFGTQWHPEKAPFEWSDAENHNSIPHSLDAIRASQYLAETFVQKARKNQNHFESQKDEQDNLIYNYAPDFVQKLYKSSFIQCYFFNDTVY